MGNIDAFKDFVKQNPELIKFVTNGEMTWQKFYELYDIYGEDNNAWKDYLGAETTSNTSTKAVATAATGIGFAEILNWLKQVNLDSVREGIGNVQRVIGVLQDFSSKDTDTKPKEEYKPRPLYKHFED